MRVKLKMRFLEETVFDLPVNQNSSRGRNVVRLAISPRQLAYLALVQDGCLEEQIAARWNISPCTVRNIRDRALERLGVASVQQAIKKMGRELAEWRDILPLDGRHRRLKSSFSVLSSVEVRVLREMALGRTDKQMAAQLALPVSTIAGWRQRVREKLQSATTQAAVAKAVSVGLLRPQDPSPTMLLAAYERLASPANAERAAALGIMPPTERQMEYLRALADGLNVDQAARRMGMSAHAGSQLRQRIWQLVNASSYTQALERVRELGVLRWPPGDGEVI